MSQIVDNNKPKQDSRWWEFYFVRYFVGTTLGAIIVLFLAMSESPVFISQGEIATILQTLRPDKFESGYILVLATLGLAFSYLASSPILVLHATRGSLFKKREIKSWKLIMLFIIVTFFVSGIQIYTFWKALLISDTQCIPNDFYFGSILFFCVSLIFVGQLFLLWLSLSGREKYAYEYYDSLVKKRARADEAGKEYIESYRHLREHGNAFFIVLLEFLLGATLFYSPVPWSVLLMIWIFPAIGVWVFGTLMEKRNF